MNACSVCGVRGHNKRRHETSAEVAARFIESQRRRSPRTRTAKVRRRKSDRVYNAPVYNADPRISVDFARPTLELIHRAIVYLHAHQLDKDRDRHLIPIAENMVAEALGIRAMLSRVVCNTEDGTVRGGGEFARREGETR